VPDSIWLPSAVVAPPPEAKVLFDFETGGWPDGWTRSGTAWGNGPVAAALPGQDLVLGATGLRFATSMNGGDDEIGRVTSPMFTLDGARLTMLLGGGTDASKLRVELWVDDAIANSAFRGVPESVCRAIRTLQPFETNDLGRWAGGQLSNLHELARIDRHRVPPIHAAVVLPDYATSDATTSPTARIHSGGEWANGSMTRDMSRAGSFALKSSSERRQDSRRGWTWPGGHTISLR